MLVVIHTTNQAQTKAKKLSLIVLKEVIFSTSSPRSSSYFKMTNRHFENCRGEGPVDEVDNSVLTLLMSF